MVKAELSICISEENGLEISLDLLKRGDAKEQEWEIANYFQDILLGVMDAMGKSMGAECDATIIKESPTDTKSEKGISKENFVTLIKAIPTGDDDSKIDDYCDAVDKIDDAYTRGYLIAKMEALNESLSSDSQDYKDEFLFIIKDLIF